MVLLSEYHQGLILKGLTLGLLHVVAGPDHLSALAALAVGTSYRAFLLGFRWGIGHSTGLIVVTIVFVALKGELDLRKLGRYCDSLVGIFMILLGCYGVISALRTYKFKRNKKDNTDPTTTLETEANVNVKRNSPVSRSKSNGSIVNVATANNSTLQVDEESQSIEMSNIETESNPSESLLSYLDEQSRSNSIDNKSSFAVFVDDHHHHHVVDDCAFCPFIDMHDQTTQRILSFFIGLLHGVAGPGGILGVLPAVEMQDWRNSFLYLGSFIFASTMSMGTFAALYGESTKRIGATAETVELFLSVFSSSMSILVGCVWLVFSILGKLDEFFH